MPAITQRAAAGLITVVLSTGAAFTQELGGCPMFPKNNIWNTPVDTLPVHPNSAKYVEFGAGGLDRNLHPDFGMPFAIVPKDQRLVPITFIEGAANSDPGPYPIPPNVPVEKGSDAHALVLQQGACKLWEVLDLKTKPDGSYTGYSGAVFDLKSNALRPDGWTSADAAGAAILPGLVRYDEIQAGEIRHAVRVTVPKTRREYVWPARHFASRSDDENLPAMGQRFRLKASFDISGFHPDVQILLRALKKYGMVLSDNGAAWYLTGADDARWNQEIWAQIKSIKGPQLEAVDVSSLMVSPNSGLAGTVSLVARQELAFSATPVIDLQAGTTISLRLTGNVIASSLVNLTDGLQVAFLICQDDAGGHDFTWPPNVSGGVRVGVTARTCSAQQFVSDGKGLYATSPGATDLPRLD
jgi:hypothetical protein